MGSAPSRLPSTSSPPAGRAIQDTLQSRSPFLLFLVVLSIVLHLGFFWQRALQCSAGVQGSSSRPASDRILNGLRDVDAKLDTLFAKRSASDAAAVTSLVVGLRAQLNTFLAEYESQGDGPEGGGRIAAAGLADGAGAARRKGEKGVQIFVGVFSGITDRGKLVDAEDDPETQLRYNYGKRRQAIRDTWFPGDGEEHIQMQRELGITMQFIIGHSNDAEEERQIAEENEEHSDILRLPIVESYDGLANKTKSFFRAVMEGHSPDWIVKVDDDIYLMPDRLLAAAKQWKRMGAGYIGCMKHGDVWKYEGTRWFEPQHILLGSDYFLHAYGSLYVMSREVVEKVIIRNMDNLRMLANEDTSVGVWMLSHNVTHFEDMRLCSEECATEAIGIRKKDCMGLCSPTKDMYIAHRTKSCREEATDPLPYMPSYPDHEKFESMWV